MRISTDEIWKCYWSVILKSEIDDGEVYDMKELGWNGVGFDDGAWDGVKILKFPTAKLVAPDAPPARVIEKVSPKYIFKGKSGKTIIDFGQNLVGVVRIKSVLIPAEQKITFKHTEVLEDGELAIRPLRVAKFTDVVVF